MTQEEFNKKLIKQLTALPAYRKVEFGLYVCKKLYPDYVFFSANNQWGDTDLLQEAIFYCEANKNLDGVKNDKTQKLIDAMDSIIPDTEDFGSCDGSYALNAGAAVWELLNYLLDKDVNRLLNISTLMTDTIDFKLQEADNTLTDNQLINHLAITEEQKHQLRLTKPEGSFFKKIIHRIKGD